MLRILVLSPVDWRRDGLDCRASYLRETALRMAREGHYVTTACPGPGIAPLRKTRTPTVEVVQNVQMVRMGVAAVYRLYAETFVTRLAASGKLARLYDVIVDAVHTRPLALRRATRKTPVVPLVFGLRRAVQPEELGDGPVLVVSADAEREALRAGVGEDRAVRVPFGIGWSAGDPDGDAALSDDAPGPCRIIAVTSNPARLARALDAIDGGASDAATLVITRQRTRRDAAWPDGIRVLAWNGDAPALSAWLARSAHRPDVAYCGRGLESTAPLFTAMGVPVVCRDTRCGRACVEAGATGLLHRASRMPGLPDRLRAIRDGIAGVLGDADQTAALREGIEAARSQRTWEQTTTRMLSVLTTL